MVYVIQIALMVFLKDVMLARLMIKNSKRHMEISNFHMIKIVAMAITFIFYQEYLNL